MEIYPASIPLPTLRDGRFAASANLVMDQMAGGNIKTRARWLGDVPVAKQFTWRLRPTQAALFEGWVKYFLQQGLKTFSMTIPTPTGRIEHSCRFLSDPREDFAPLSEMLWEYNARVLVMRRASLTESETVDAYFEGVDIHAAIELIAATLADFVE